MQILKKIIGYLTFKKEKEDENVDNTSLKMMHGMNKISIFLFLICLVIMVVKCAR